MIYFDKAVSVLNITLPSITYGRGVLGNFPLTDARLRRYSTTGAVNIGKL